MDSSKSLDYHPSATSKTLVLFLAATPYGGESAETALRLAEAALALAAGARLLGVGAAP